jgi:hypothetical protein
MVGSRQVTLGDEGGESDELRVYPSGPDAILVAVVRGSDVPQGSSTLWRVPCGAGPPETFAQIERADFGHSALAADGRTLFFTGENGIFTLDLKTRNARRLTRPTFPYCTKNDVPAQDVVVGFIDPRTLVFQRGCGYMWSWNGQDMWLRDPGTSRMTALRATALPTSVAVDRGGGLWMADGTCTDDSTFRRVLFSRDRGETWRKVPLKEIRERPVREVITDRTKVGALLVFTLSCGNAQHSEPGWVYVTEDGGKTLRPVAAPPGIPAREDGYPEDEQDPLQAVVAPDGTLGHLLLYGSSSAVTGDMLAQWESRDGGRTWRSLAPVAKAPETPTSPVAAGDAQYTIRKNGLYRAQKGQAAVRVYPRK